MGVNNIDVIAASRRGVVVMNTPGANTISTAEHAFALLIALARNIGPAYVGMREGRWDKKSCLGAQLAGATLGVVGLGRIGQTVAKRAVAFGMTVIGMDPQADAVVDALPPNAHVPLTLTSWLVRGSSTLRGTEPSAPW